MLTPVARVAQIGLTELGVFLVPFFVDFVVARVAL